VVSAAGLEPALPRLKV